MNPLSLLGAGSSLSAPNTTSSGSDLTGGSIVFSSPFAVGAGASASGGGSPSLSLVLAAAAAVGALVLLARR